MRKITVISAGLSTPSSTRMLADQLANASVEQLKHHSIEAEISTFELRDYAHEIMNNMITGFADEKLTSLLEATSQADALIVVTPIFSTSYSGLFKSFIDILDPDALQGTPVLIGANAGTARHSLAIDYAIRPLFAYLHTEPVSTGVFAASEDWSDGGDKVAPLSSRILRGAQELALAISQKSVKQAAYDPYDPDTYEAAGRSFGHLLGGFTDR
ncbi:MAG: FMN reductase [Microbacteriaceae bacterium]